MTRRISAVYVGKLIRTIGATVFDGIVAKPRNLREVPPVKAVRAAGRLIDA